MSPRFALSDAANGGPCNTEAKRKFGVWLANGGEDSDLNDQCPGQLGRMRSLAALPPVWLRMRAMATSFSCTPLESLVLHVHEGRTREDMGRVNARRIIATMKAPWPIGRHRTMDQRPCKNLWTNTATLPNLDATSIPVAVPRASPEPAVSLRSVAGSFVYLGPEALCWTRTVVSGDVYLSAVVAPSSDMVRFSHVAPPCDVVRSQSRTQSSAGSDYFTAKSRRMGSTNADQ